MLKKLSKNLLITLYHDYASDLKRVRSYQRKLYARYAYSGFEKYVTERLVPWLSKALYTERGVSLYRAMRAITWRFEERRKILRMKPQLCDVEAELTYLLIREFTPESVVEIAPGGGWSSTWLLNALKDNGVGTLYSYDLVDLATKIVPSDLSNGRWTFIQGDISQKLHQLPSTIDYLFLDADHTADFARWYIHKLFPKLNRDVPVSIHDVFYREHPPFDFEGGVVVEWLQKKRITYFTAAPEKDKDLFEKITAIKTKLHHELPIHRPQINTMLFFLSQ
jgi:predicted O-methyltransferase YrrM